VQYSPLGTPTASQQSDIGAGSRLTDIDRLWFLLHRIFANQLKFSRGMVHEFSPKIKKKKRNSLNQILPEEEDDSAKEAHAPCKDRIRCES
jgi:hypothetical protein